jgi:hypothetical protein
MPSRRRLLGAVASLPLTAGCVYDLRNDSSKALHFEPVPESELGAKFVYTEREWSPTQRRVVAAGVPDGTEFYGIRPFEDGEYVVVDGVYYAVSVAEHGRESVERPVLTAERVSEADGEARDFGDFSDADRRALKCAVASSDGDGPEPCVVHAGEASAFWPEPDPRHVEVGGDHFRLSAETATVSLTRYEYAFDRVADSRSAFLDRLGDDLLAVDFAEVDLTPDQREMLATAASEDVYSESPPYSEGFQELLETFEEGRRRHEDYVRFDGDYYLARIDAVYDD